MSKCSAKNRRCAGGDEWCIGGTLRIEDGATLDVAEGATVNGLAAGGGGGAFVVINNLGTYNKPRLDKTFAEMQEYKDEGIMMFVNHGGRWLPYIGDKALTEIHFGGVAYGIYNGDYANYIEKIIVTDNTVTFIQEGLAPASS